MPKDTKHVRLVWSIMDNAWVTLEYWNWVNGK